jgi:glycosyltransferase involved in cell wall biosynthesis
MNTKISAIICVFNEEKTIKEIVTTICDYFFDEVIVVNDGSIDKTSEILKELKVRYNFINFTLKQNKGKGYAMAKGVEIATNDIVLFIDADLSNLKAEHLSELVIPIINNKADMVLGQATETMINYRINPFKSLTGERTLFRKDVVPILEKMKHSQFGVETLINLYYKSKGKRVKYVILSALKHPTKFEKTTKTRAIKEFVKEGRQIAITTFNNFDLITSSIKNKLNK